MRSRLLDHDVIESVAVVMAIVLLFVVMVFVVNPSERVKTIRDATRVRDTQSILAAVTEYQSHNNGSLPPGIDSEASRYQILGIDGSGCADTCGLNNSVSSCLDLTDALAGTSLIAIPLDPASGTSENSGYAINKTIDGRVEVIACHPERTETISVER